MLHDTSLVILYHNLNVPYVRDEIKRLIQRYANRMEKYPDILAINLTREAKILRRLKGTLPQDAPDRIVIL